MADLVRLVWFETKESNKYAADRPTEYLGSRGDIRRLWFLLDQAGWPHVEVYLLSGERLDPERSMMLWRREEDGK